MRWGWFILILHRISPLSAWLIGLTFILLFFMKQFFQQFRWYLTMTEWVLIWLFTTSHLFTFYILFEMVLLPIFWMLLFYDHGTHRRFYAGLVLVLFTLVGSFCFLFAILALYLHTGSLDIRWLNQFPLETNFKYYVCFSILSALAIKLPIFPAHLWLTEAHVESSTPGSIILAALLLKLGSYGMVQFVFPFYEINIWASSIWSMVGGIGVLYGGLFALRQTDLKKWIAYSSISHMGLNLMGLFSQSIWGIMGGLLMIFSHAISASGLFFMAGSINHRSGSKLWYYQQGIIMTMPMWSVMWAIYQLFNLGFPGGSAFIAEYWVFTGILQYPIAAALGLTGVFLSGAYSWWLFCKITMGSLSPWQPKWQDLNIYEISFLSFGILFNIIIGIQPDFLIDSLLPNIMGITHTTILFRCIIKWFK